MFIKIIEINCTAHTLSIFNISMTLSILAFDYLILSTFVAQRYITDRELRTQTFGIRFCLTNFENLLLNIFIVSVVWVLWECHRL